MRIGRVTLVAGSAILGTSLLLRSLIGDPGNGAIIKAIDEGLLILSWVAMWHPVDSKYDMSAPDISGSDEKTRAEGA